MQNRYFIMRHGESKANRQGIIVSHPIQGLNGYGLTSFGAEQVTQASINTRLKPSTLIVSSDFLRASETAEILNRIICADDPVRYDLRLRERDFGRWNLCDQRNYARVWQADVQSPNSSINGTESVHSVLSRGLSLINDLDQQHSSRDILLVGHGDVLQILLSYRYNLEPHQHRTIAPLRNAEIRRLAELNTLKIA